VKLVIDSDAHSIEHLRFMRYGIDQARRGWLEREQVVNTMSWTQLQQWLQRRHS
jgi:DNA polymerase (family 10)